MNYKWPQAFLDLGQTRPMQEDMNFGSEFIWVYTPLSVAESCP